MCVSPLVLKSGQVIACRKCWQCRENRVNDWVGRCIAESETATASNSITLTYGRDELGREDHERAAVLTYSDVQKYFKLLRRHGYPCRYFAVGEVGAVKGRCHWHVVVFWQGPVPPHDPDKRFMERHWPHGWSYWEKPSPASIRYVCKYIQKDIRDAEKQGHLAMSKKPPLGAEYFDRLARKYVDQGLAPQSPYYSFAHVRDKNDKPVQFYLAGVSLDNFCQAFLNYWAIYRGGHYPSSPLIDEFCDRIARPPSTVLLEPFRPGGSVPWIPPPEGCEMKFSQPHNSYYYERNGTRYFWSYNSGGERAWQRKINPDPDIRRSSSGPPPALVYPPEGMDWSRKRHQGR